MEYILLLNYLIFYYSFSKERGNLLHTHSLNKTGWYLGLDTFENVFKFGST
jgi:hypothetical protein